eukprot:2387694-Pyramimonas_sp.AAC.1
MEGQLSLRPYYCPFRLALAMRPSCVTMVGASYIYPGGLDNLKPCATQLYVTIIISLIRGAALFNRPMRVIID